MLVIRCDTIVQAPPERCFDLARSVDLHVDSSAEIAARAIEGRCSGLSEQGDETVWSARFFGLRFAMKTTIEDLSFPRRFRDRMTSGLLRQFAHTYRFEPLPGDGCAMSDELTLEAPGGPFGRLMEKLYLGRRMQHLVEQRLRKIKAVAQSRYGWQRYLKTPP